MIKEYELYLDGVKQKIGEMRVSKYPLNRHWPGFQRPLDQTEVTGFASFDVAGKREIRIECGFDFDTVTVRPLSLGVVPAREGRSVTFSIDRPCQAVVEFDDLSGCLHLFADPVEEPFDKNGEDVLYFGPGEHDAGHIEVRSGQTVYIDRGAVVYGEIYGTDVENVTIRGRGILDHSKMQPDTQVGDFVDPPRPSPIEIRYSRNVEMRDVIVRDPCFLAVRPIACENVLIDNVKVIGCWRYNSDGIDFINSRHGRVRNCFVRTFDDSFCLKGFCYPFIDQMTHNGKVYDVMEDVVFSHCVAFNDWGKALEVGVDICAAEMKDCRFEDCDVIHATTMALDVTNVDTCHVHDIAFENIRVEYEEMSYPPVIQETEDQVYPGPNASFMPWLMYVAVECIPVYSTPGDVRGKISNISFRDIRITAPKMPPSRVAGFSEEYGVSNVVFENITLNGKKVKRPQVESGRFAENIEWKE